MNETTTIGDVAREVAGITGWSDYDAQQWTIENAIGGDMIPASSGADAEVSDGDRIILLDVAENTDEHGVYSHPS